MCGIDMIAETVEKAVELAVDFEPISSQLPSREGFVFLLALLGTMLFFILMIGVIGDCPFISISALTDRVKSCKKNFHKWRKRFKKKIHKMRKRFKKRRVLATILVMCSINVPGIVSLIVPLWLVRTIGTPKAVVVSMLMALAFVLVIGTIISFLILSSDVHAPSGV